MKNFSGIVTFNHRTLQNTEAKREIAQKAATMVHDGDIIFLDQSSTAFYLANELMSRSCLTVVTNNVEIMMLLSNSAVKVLSSGGYLSEENRNCLIGSDAQKTFENIFATLAFFSVRAISDDGCVTDCTREEVTVRNAMFKNSNKKVLLCDSSKFGLKASFVQCHVKDVDYLISEGNHAQRFSQLGRNTHWL